MKLALLNHSTRKLRRFVVVGAIMAALAFWIDADPPEENYHGRGAWLVTLLGPTGMWWFMALFGAGALIVSITCIRLLFSRNRVAAMADRDGVTIRGIFGTKYYCWNEIDDVRLRSISGGPRIQHLLQIDGRARRNCALSASTVEGGVDAIREWINEAAMIHQSTLDGGSKAGSGC